MSSILTNTSAMVALQTLKGINQNLSKTQNDISTGKAISSARENAAIWAISKTMESDVLGFKGISDSLALGSSTIAVARSAAEKVTDLLNEVKQKIVASQEDNQDRAKIQLDINALRDEIASITGAAQFNGLNMLSNAKGGATAALTAGNTGLGAGIKDSRKVDILASLDRSANGSVKASSITVNKSDLGTGGVTWGVTAVDLTNAMTISAASVPAISATGAEGTSTVTIVGDTATNRLGIPVLAGDGYSLTGAGGDVRYVARDGDTKNDIARELAARFNFVMASQGKDVSATVDGATFTIHNRDTSAVTLALAYSTSGTAGGGLELLSKIDVTTANGANAALGAIEGLTQTAIRSAAEFGSSQKRIDIQRSFVGDLMDSLKAGIGSLVDADMEEASARLQALQVQQQLGIQALSIANQAPQNILTLFR